MLFKKRQHKLKCSNFNRLSQSYEFIIFLLLCVLYLIYYIFAVLYNPNEVTLLSIVGAILIIYLISTFFRKLLSEYNILSRWSNIVKNLLFQLKEWIKNNWNIISWVVCTILLIINCIYLLESALETTRKLRCLVTCILILFIAMLTSNNPYMINWRLVITIQSIQTLIAHLVFNSTVGFDIFDYIYGEFSKFVMSYPSFGAAKIFGDPWMLLHPNVFYVTSIGVFIGCLFCIIYHLFIETDFIKSSIIFHKNLTQFKFSLYVGIFYGIISGCSLEFSVLFGVELTSIIKGVFIFLPTCATLFLISCPPSNRDVTIVNYVLVYKETPSNSQIVDNDTISNQKNERDRKNFYGAMCQGAIIGWKVSWRGVALFIATTSIYYFVDSIIVWLASRLGFRENLATTFGYTLSPVAYMIGSNWGNESQMIGSFMAEKLFGFTQTALQKLGYSSLMGRIPSSLVVTATHACLGFSSLGLFCITMANLQTYVSKIYHTWVLSCFPRILFVVNLTSLYVAATGVVVFSPSSNLLDSIGCRKNFVFSAYNDKCTDNYIQDCLRPGRESNGVILWAFNTFIPNHYDIENLKK